MSTREVTGLQPVEYERRLKQMVDSYVAGEKAHTMGLAKVAAEYRASHANMTRDCVNFFKDLGVKLLYSRSLQGEEQFIEIDEACLVMKVLADLVVKIQWEMQTSDSDSLHKSTKDKYAKMKKTILNKMWCDGMIKEEASGESSGGKPNLSVTHELGRKNRSKEQYSLVAKGEAKGEVDDDDTSSDQQDTTETPLLINCNPSSVEMSAITGSDDDRKFQRLQEEHDTLIIELQRVQQERDTLIIELRVQQERDKAISENNAVPEERDTLIIQSPITSTPYPPPTALLQTLTLVQTPPSRPLTVEKRLEGSTVR
jgi:hypothetical protein